MTSDTPSDEIIRPVRRLEVVTVGARQRWSEDAKRALVLETFGKRWFQAAEAHGRRSSSRLAGQPCTIFVSTSVK